MKALSRLFVAVSLAAGASFASGADIVDTAISAGQFTTLVTAVKEAGLAETLKGKGPFTVFAPTDAAFAKLPAGTLDALLKDKQKLKGYYGNLTEKQFTRIYTEAARRKGNTSENLIGLLESRLDAVVYRAKFVPTPFAARQFVNHGHVTVNGKRVNIPSYRVKPGDVVQVRERSRNMALVLEALQSAERDTPDYVELDPKGMSAKFIRIPELAEVPYPVKMEPHLVVEFYAS